LSPVHFFVQFGSFFWHSAADFVSQLGLVVVLSANALIETASNAATARVEILFMMFSFVRYLSWWRAE
jgi:hypothetical protein